jgi:hypothetical protein
VYRRTGRFDQARKQLRRLSRTGGPKWSLEVSRELALMDHFEREQQQREPEQATDQPAAA